MFKNEQDFSIRNLFIPITTAKAIHIIVVLGFIVFFNALFNGFVWDDKVFIIYNPDFQNFNLFQLFGHNTFNHGSFYRPIPAIYFGLLYKIFETQPFFYHFLQIIFHIVNTCLLFYLLKRFTDKALAFWGSLFFLIHPTQVESVAYIAASQNELVFFFGIVALLISIKEKLTKKHLSLIFFFLLLSLLTKETGIIFMFMVLVYQYLFVKNRFIKMLLIEIGLLIIYFLMRFAIGNVFFERASLVPISRLTLLQRIINIPEIIFYYFKIIFYPARLAIDQQWTITNIDLKHLYIPLFIDISFFLLIFSGGYTIYRYNKKIFKNYLFFSIWFLLGIIMLLQIFSLDMTVAERWIYIPFVGFIGMVGILFQNMSLKNNYFKCFSIIFTSALLCIFAGRTMIRNANWENSTTLYAHDIKVEDNFDNEDNYGAELGLSGKYKDSIMHLRKSIALFPYEANYANLALSYEKAGDLSSAEAAYNQALNLKGYNIDAHIHAEVTYIDFSELLLNRNSFREAVNVLREGIKDYPTNSQLWLCLAYAEYKLYNQNEALFAASQAYKFGPNDITLESYNRIREELPLKINFTLSQ